jgi:hypothetical protein
MSRWGLENMTEKKIAANRKNALKSTGPRTKTGKSKVSLNALKHGMRASCLAIPGLEQRQDWEVHRRQSIRDLAPTNYLEMVLADRVASLLWRLGRVVRYESEVIAIAVKKAEETREESDDIMGSVTIESLDNLRLTLHEAVDHEKRLSRIFDLEPPACLSGQDAVFALRAVAAGLNVDGGQSKRETSEERTV